jgi:uncharacterized protein (TIGR03083 family)
MARRSVTAVRQTDPVDLNEHIDSIAANGEVLVERGVKAGLDAPVPGCPDWVVRDLLIHIGGVHHWAADLVANARDGFDSPAAAAIGTGPADDALPDWCARKCEELVTVLRAAPADLACATFVPSPSALGFWARRQAHETAIHRSDAEAAAGGTTPFDTDFALDGIDEVLTVFAARRKGFEPATLRLAPTDGPPVVVTLTASGAVVADPGEPPDVTVSGPASEVYRWLWNRPAEVEYGGDPALAQRWRKLRIRWS